jgi:hypothetical protein
LSVTPAGAQSRLRLGPLELGHATLTIGEEDGMNPRVFGAIASAALDRSGNLYVLDGSDNTIRVFDQNGRWLGTFARSGRGPGDLSTPNRLLYDGTGRLFVTDEVNGVVEFGVDATGQLRHRRTFGVDLRPRSACLFGRKLVIGGYRQRRIIHAIDSAGTVATSFGNPIPPIIPREILAQSGPDTTQALLDFANRAAVILSCSDSADLIVAAQAAGPTVRAYRGDGALLWEYEIPAYQGNKYFRQGGDLVVAYGKDFTTTVEIIDDRCVLVQVRRSEFGRGASGSGGRVSTQPVALRSILLDSRTGVLLAEGSSLPWIATARGGLAVEARIDPFPVVRVRALSWHR